VSKLLIYESRRLVLPIETVVDAVVELDREHGGRLALATLAEARIETGAQPGLLLEVLHADSVEAEQRRFSLPAIAAAVIHYCWKCRIPVPRNATKTIEIVPEGFALMLQATLGVPRRHGALAGHAPSDAADSAEEPSQPHPGNAAVSR
jgi:hypothetical protein